MKWLAIITAVSAISMHPYLSMKKQFMGYFENDSMDRHENCQLLLGDSGTRQPKPRDLRVRAVEQAIQLHNKISHVKVEAADRYRRQLLQSYFMFV